MLFSLFITNLATFEEQFFVCYPCMQQERNEKLENDFLVAACYAPNREKILIILNH